MFTTPTSQHPPLGGPNVSTFSVFSIFLEKYAFSEKIHGALSSQISITSL